MYLVCKLIFVNQCKNWYIFSCVNYVNVLAHLIEMRLSWTQKAHASAHSDINASLVVTPFGDKFYNDAPPFEAQIHILSNCKSLKGVKALCLAY